MPQLLVVWYRWPDVGSVDGYLWAQGDCRDDGRCRKRVLKHLAHQLEVLGDIDPHAVAAITSIVDEEQHHHDHSAAQIDVRDPWFRFLAPMVTAWTETVIWMGMRS